MIQVDYSEGYHNENTPITITSEANNQSCIASFTCVSKVIECIEERLPLLSPLQSIYIWSDGCAAQF